MCTVVHPEAGPGQALCHDQEGVYLKTDLKKGGADATVFLSTHRDALEPSEFVAHHEYVLTVSIVAEAHVVL